jgi:DNA-binding Xre family transcriptional regulator
MATSLKRGKCLLRHLLRKRRMTQVELIHRTGISKSNMSRYVNNIDKMNIDTAATIAYALGCRIEDLYEWELDDKE